MSINNIINKIKEVNEYVKSIDGKLYKHSKRTDSDGNIIEEKYEPPLENVQTEKLHKTQKQALSASVNNAKESIANDIIKNIKNMLKS